MIELTFDATWCQKRKATAERTQSRLKPRQVCPALRRAGRQDL